MTNSSTHWSPVERAVVSPQKSHFINIAAVPFYGSIDAANQE